MKKFLSAYSQSYKMVLFMLTERRRYLGWVSPWTGPAPARFGLDRSNITENTEDENTLELQTKVREHFTITEKPLLGTRGSSWLKAPTNIFTFKIL